MTTWRILVADDRVHKRICRLGGTNLRELALEADSQPTVDEAFHHLWWLGLLRWPWRVVKVSEWSR